MERKNDILGFLTAKPQRSAEDDRRFEECYRASVAAMFEPVAEDIAQRRHREYMLKGGRGSTKSSFVSETIFRVLRDNADGHHISPGADQCPE